MQCELCKAELKQITYNHLRQAHGLTTAEYRAMGYETITPDQRARQAKGLTRRIQKGENLGADHPRYKGGHVSKASGYRLVRHEGRLTLEHRVVMERVLGRPLKRSEHVHHIDGDPLNNAPENLCVMSQSEHSALHHEVGQTEHGKRFTKPPISKPMALDVNRMVELRSHGFTIEQVAAEMGVSRYTVMRRLKSHPSL